MISFAIMGVVITAMSSMFATLNRESKAVSEKLGAMDLEKVLIGALADGSGCMYALTKPTELTFNAGTALSATNPLVIPLPGDAANPARLYMSYDPTAANPLGPVVVQVGQSASPYSSSLMVKSIALELTDISGGNVNGRLRVDFDESRLVRPIKPAYVSLALRADVTNSAAAKFTSCQGANVAGGGGGDSGEWCGAFTGHVGNSWSMEIFQVISKCKGVTPTCPPGYNYTAPWCMQSGNAFPVGKLASSACPSGYSLRNLFASAPDPSSGTSDFLMTCMPN